MNKFYTFIKFKSMIDYYCIYELLLLSKIISCHVKNFNDIVIDCTKDYTILNSTLLCKNIPKIVKINSEEIESYKNARFYTKFNENEIGPDEQVRLLTFDDLNFLNDDCLKNFIDILQFPLISKTETDKIKISKFTKYYKARQLDNNYFLYLVKT